MYEIIVKGDADQLIGSEEDCDCEHLDCQEPVYKDISEVDGLSCDVDFVEYIDNQQLKEKLIYGFCELKIENDILMSVTTYRAKEKLTSEELEYLKKYTQGQWSDGIGEGFEQELHNGCYVSMWHAEQQVTINQTKKEE